MSNRKLISVVCGLLLMALCAFCIRSKAADPKGWLMVEGGSYPINPEIAKKFCELIGGADQFVLLVPTATDDETLKAAMGSGLLDKIAASLGLKDYKILHTRDRNEANSETFVAPIRRAKGVWFLGGRPGRYADAYLGTRVQKEMEAFFDRGGVIGGSSGGAMILGSFLIYGGVGQDDFKEIIEPTHQQGFGLLPNVVIDPHVNERHNEGEMAGVISVHPELLGIGVDAGTALIVHNHSFELAGGPEARAVITDGKDHNGKPYYFVKPGERFNLEKRTVETSGR